MNERLEKAAPWHRQYPALKLRVAGLRQVFQSRCSELGLDSRIAPSEFWKDLIVRAVRESNWQEGEYLDEPRTRELVMDALRGLEDLKGPHFDGDLQLATHRLRIAEMKKRGATNEEIAAQNLGLAYGLIPILALEIVLRQLAEQRQILSAQHKLLASAVEVPREGGNQPPIKEGPATPAASEVDETSILYPVTGGFRVQTDYEAALGQLDSSALREFVPYCIDLLHSITMTGILPLRKCGRHRTHSVRVGSETVYFSPHKLVPSLMKEFSELLWHSLGNVRSTDAVLEAARMSYRFAMIHPYSDGNGRLSRLIMNLVLFSGRYLPAYLKADKAGRHRYSQALRRANRGDIEPLAALIAVSLVQSYERANQSIAPHTG